MIDIGRTLWESNAIVCYLCESREAHDLLPENVWSIALAQQCMGWYRQLTARQAYQDNVMMTMN